MNPHTVLGVDQNATPEQIKSAYRKLAMQHHPDRAGDSADSRAKFQEVQDAYEALTKPQSRSQSGNDHPFRHHPFAWSFTAADFKPTNSDYRVNAHVTLEQVFNGDELSMTMPGGKIVTVAIPTGIQHGQTIVISGEGGREYSDQPPGDLHVLVVFKPHARFSFGGADLLAEVEVDALDLLIGTETIIELLNGEKLSVKLPAGVQTRMRLAGKGLPLPAQYGSAGNLFLDIKPVFRALSKKQIDLLKKAKKLDETETTQ